jgi:hypothetical protein
MKDDLVEIQAPEGAPVFYGYFEKAGAEFILTLLKTIYLFCF